MREDVGRFTVREFTARDGEEATRWRYGGPWAVYDPRAGAPPLRAEDGYFAVTDAASGALAGFGCTGVEARVPGLAAEPGTLDMGVGMAPDLVGRGHGRAFGAAVLGRVRETAAPDVVRLRVVVQCWNARSLRLARALGFAGTGTHVCVQDGREVPYAVLGRPLGTPLSVRGGIDGLMSVDASVTPDFGGLLDLVEERSAVFREAVRVADQGARVPGCPDWSVRDLAEHLGGVQRFWAAVVTAGPAEGPPAEDAVVGREVSGDLLEWSAESADVLLAALRQAGPDRPCWTWWGSSDQPATSGAVARHQVQEAAVHAFDAQEAAGHPVALPATVALDGVAEFLQVGYGAMGGWTPWPHPPAVVGWAADEGPSWQLELTEAGGARTVPGGTRQAAATAHGTASDLVLALYGRIPADRLRVDGDPAAVTRLLAWSPVD